MAASEEKKIYGNLVRDYNKWKQARDVDVNINVNATTSSTIGSSKPNKKEQKSWWQKLKEPKTGEEAKSTFWGFFLFPLRVLAYLIKNFGVPILAILLLVAGIIFFYRASEAGVLQSITNDGLVAIKRTGAPIAAKYGFFKFGESWWNPETLRDPYSLETEVVDTGINYGVEILSWESLSAAYISKNNEPIDIRLAANIQAISLPQEDLDLTFDCYIIESEGLTKGITTPDTKIIPMGTNTNEPHDILCSFRDYDKFKRKVESKTAVFTSRFNFISQSKFPAYLLSYEDYRNLLELKVDNPFDYYKVQDPRLNGRVAISRSPKGPIEVSIGTLKKQTQPFIEHEDNEYIIAVGLKNANAFGLGNLRRVDSIILNVPDAVELVTGNDCDFVTTGEELSIGGGKFKQYEVDQSSLAIANRDCDLLGVAASKDCVQGKEELRFICGFRVKELEGTDQIFYTEFASEVKYEYEVKELRAILIKNEEDKGSGCELLAENECKITEGCIAKYENNQFSNCGYCSAELRVCGDYNNETDCNKNPCSLGNCRFENGICKSI